MQTKYKEHLSNFVNLTNFVNFGRDKYKNGDVEKSLDILIKSTLAAAVGMGIMVFYNLINDKNKYKY
jgi:hypothetical protein